MPIRLAAITLTAATLAASVLPVPARAWAALLAAAGVASLLAGMDVLLARARARTAYERAVVTRPSRWADTGPIPAVRDVPDELAGRRSSRHGSR